jgi:diguanylate cyclase (GGDEF)-like protein
MANSDAAVFVRDDARPDALTGLMTRKQFLVLAEAEWARCRSDRRPLSLLAADIDYCQQINGHFGHRVGDRLIVHVADLCRAIGRAPDILARVKGEEFAILLPETALAQAEIIAERLRRMVEATPLLTDGERIPATVSVGVAEAHRAVDGIAALMTAADDALLEAKLGGRNRVMRAAEPGPSG